jgi:hypothetical protein
MNAVPVAPRAAAADDQYSAVVFDGGDVDCFANGFHVVGLYGPLCALANDSAQNPLFRNDVACSTINEHVKKNVTFPRIDH